jgi:hypothetical protein
MTFQTEFMSFPIKRGKEARAQEWIDALRQHPAECVKTLDRECMHLESIFRSVLNGVTYLSWFSVQGTAGAQVVSSRSQAPPEECVDRSVYPIGFEHVVSFIPPSVLAAIEDRDRLLRPAAT